LGKNNELKIQFFGSKKLSTCFFGHHSGQKMDNTDDVLSIFFFQKNLGWTTMQRKKGPSRTSLNEIGQTGWLGFLGLTMLGLFFCFFLIIFFLFF
jgi:hypothetical protein